MGTQIKYNPPIRNKGNVKLGETLPQYSFKYLYYYYYYYYYYLNFKWIFTRWQW
jgi:hypothetical protein